MFKWLSMKQMTRFFVESESSTLNVCLHLQLKFTRLNTLTAKSSFKEQEYGTSKL